ncbi:type IV pilus assembly protein PilM, partial [Zavarzinella formosa]|uniref:type IV pilus assembly protein PilM n=1 Tax=Zavarzinella formosa TaxID=360055 RepID=UPI00187DBBA2
MAVNPGFWGIDIGQCALKAIRLEMIGGVVTTTAFDYVEHPKILSQPDANPDELTREALEKFLERNPVKGDMVAMSVPGQSGLARFVKLPPVEEKKIGDIVKFEAKQQIPFPLDEVVWDFQKISDGVVTDGFAIDTEIGLFAMKRDMISRFIGHFLNVKMEVHTVQMAPLALVNFLTYEMMKRGGPDGEPAPPAAPGKKKCVVGMDIGTDGSNLVITDAARIIWQRPIPIGGNHFTRALTKELKLTFAKAEHLKRNAAKSPELANILKALKPVLTEFVGEVQRSLGYFTNTHRDAQIEYLVGMGSAFRLPGLQKFLAEKLQLDVRKPAKFARITGEAVTGAPVFMENLLSYPVAYGLAIQGLGVARLATNLLPPEISFDRKIRAKKPYAVAAAASLLLGTTVLAYGYSLPLADVYDGRIKTAIDKGKGVIEQANKVDKEIKDKKDEIKKTQTEVESIIAGQLERANWIAINKLPYQALPVPGENGNMTADWLAPYWRTTEGLKALEKYRQRMSQGINPLATTASDDDKREFLPTIDIEAVYSRHTKDLKTLYTNIKERRRLDIGGPRSFPGSELAPTEWWSPKEGLNMNNIPDKEREDLVPEGEGWVVEVRGYTYFHPDEKFQTNLFIRDTLLKNIIDIGRVANDEEKKRLAADPIRGKISNAFIYNVWEDKFPSAGTLKNVGLSWLDQFVPAPGAGGDAGAQPSTPSFGGAPPAAGGG